MLQFQQFFQQPVWSIVFFDNSLLQYFRSMALLVFLLVLFKVFHTVIVKRLQALAQKTATDLDDTFIAIINKLRPPFYAFLAFYISLQSLSLPHIGQTIIHAILVIWVVLLAIDSVHTLIHVVFTKTIGKTHDKESRGAYETISRVMKVALWIIGALLILQNLGINVTSLIAGLGIGGIAIALAAQNVLEDLFSSFAILFDKPFVQGDLIVVGEHRGKVEKVGIKTTRLRSLTGEEIIISNKELTSSRIQNFKRMTERRATFTFGVTYETPSEKLRSISNLIRHILKEQKGARLDGVHFKQFDNSALTFEVVIYIHSPEYSDYMDIQQEINFAIKEVFQKHSIEMAYPTQTVYLKNELNS